MMWVDERLSLIECNIGGFLNNSQTEVFFLANWEVFFLKLFMEFMVYIYTPGGTYMVGHIRNPS